MSRKKDTPHLPPKDALLSFIQDSKTPVNKRDIARAFGIKGQDRTALRALLREMEEEGAIAQTRSRTYAPKDALPETATIEITGLDADGELRARVPGWKGSGPAPAIYVIDKRRALAQGDIIVASLRRTGKHEYEARILKAADREEESHIVGVFRPAKGGGIVTPANRKIRDTYFIPAAECGKLENGDLVVAARVPPSRGAPRSRNTARIVEKLGRKDDPGLISLISIHSHGIPVAFPRAALEEADNMREPRLDEGREDLRGIPLVTIDGADARDFDDAVFAQPARGGGWRLIVAIADVSYYVRPGSALDREAYRRGNSTYFADRVVPMLPERLSNDLCSLRPGADRACLAVEMHVDKDAALTGHRFFRGLMRSAARLTYEQVEAAHNGHTDDVTAPLKDGVIAPLYKAYRMLRRAREKRGALEIDLPERKAVIDEKGSVTAIVTRERLESHQLVEEFMILANVAAAEALEARGAPCIYRVHPPPAPEKLEAARDFLKGMGYSLPRGDTLHPRNINHILKTSAEKPDKALIHTVLLRTQSQAVYSPDNIGHFGLALFRYAHFTSPIRRYADLVVHRALTGAYRLGKGALQPEKAREIDATAIHISETERRSMQAERDVTDRFTAQYLSASIGKSFAGIISGVTRFGIFVCLDESGADGIVPVSTLPRDFYIHDEKRHALVGRSSGRMYRLADPVIVKLVEADPLRASTVFELLEGEKQDKPPRREKRRGRDAQDRNQRKNAPRRKRRGRA